MCYFIKETTATLKLQKREAHEIFDVLLVQEIIGHVETDLKDLGSPEDFRVNH